MVGAARVAILFVLLAALSFACEAVHVVVIAIPCALSARYRARFHHPLWNRLIRLWGRGCYLLLRHVAGVAVTVEGSIPPGRHLIVVNHQSTAEIAVLYEVLKEKNLKFIAKSDLSRGLPSVSRAMRDGGFGWVRFDSPRASLRGLVSFSRGLEAWDGSPVIYPEGQRTEDGAPAPFQRGGTELVARESGLPVLPVVTDGLFRARTAREFFPHLPGSRCTVRILPAIPAGPETRDEGLTGRLETSMRDALEDMRAKPAPEPPRAKRADVLEIVALILTGYACHLYYNVIGHLASLRGLDLGTHLLTPLDRRIPYTAFFVLFYQIAYFVPGVVVILLLVRIGAAVATIRRIVLAFLALLFVHYALYLLVPTSAAAIRLPDAMLGSGTLADMVRGQYRLATIWCAWPSLHVSACWFFYRVLARTYPRLRTAYLVWFAGMLAGTAAIKIHYLADGLTGLVLAEAAWRGVLLPLERSGACAWMWRSETMRLALHWILLAGLLGGIPLAMRASGYQGPLYVVGAP